MDDDEEDEQYITPPTSIHGIAYWALRWLAAVAEVDDDEEDEQYITPPTSIHGIAYWALRWLHVVTKTKTTNNGSNKRMEYTSKKVILYLTFVHSLACLFVRTQHTHRSDAWKLNSTYTPWVTDMWLVWAMVTCTTCTKFEFRYKHLHSRTTTGDAGK